jgi:serine/threonine protein kinase
MYDRIGKYKILSQLGEGGMGSVYLGKHEALERFTAVKVMRKEISGDREFQKRFLQEARTTAQLQHPNIIRVYDVDVENADDGDLYYIAMEFVSQDGHSGRTLQDVLDKQEKSIVDPTRIAEIFSQLCGALAHAHSKNVLHCDIKPANVLIDEFGSVKLSDFGLAKAVGTQALRESTLGAWRTRQGKSDARGRSMEGTFLYMPPEVQEGGDWTKAGDVYSLGSVIYRLLTGKRPVGRWKTPNEMVSGLPSWWDDLLGNCLSDQGERYADGEALLSAYERAVSSPQQEGVGDPGTRTLRDPSADPLLKRAFIFLAGGEFAQADEYFEKILDIDPENARAYIGKLMVKLHVGEESRLAAHGRLLSEYLDYQRAIQFADGKYRELLQGYNQAIQERIYQEALREMKTGKSEEDFNNVLQKFLSVSGYKKADKMAGKCQKYKERLEKERTARAEKERLEKERAAQAEQERLEKERTARAEKERLEKERAAKAEQERIEKTRKAQAEVERKRVDAKPEIYQTFAEYYRDHPEAEVNRDYREYRDQYYRDHPEYVPKKERATGNDWDFWYNRYSWYCLRNLDPTTLPLLIIFFLIAAGVFGGVSQATGSRECGSVAALVSMIIGIKMMY